MVIEILKIKRTIAIDGSVYLFGIKNDLMNFNQSLDSYSPNAEQLLIQSLNLSLISK